MWTAFAVIAVLVALGMSASLILTGRRLKAEQVPNSSLLIGGLLEREVDYIDQTVEEYAQVLQQAGLPEQVAGFVAEMDRGIADGALESDSRDLQTLLGRPATTIAQALADSV